jgi:phosphoglycerate dehydrogenase-like enzyme
MKIYKATNTLNGYLPPLEFTADETSAEIILVGGKKFNLDDFPKLRGIFKTGVGTDNLPFAQASARGVDIELPSDTTRDIIFEETAAFTCHLILTGLYADSGDWAAWSKADRNTLHNRKLLVVGAGRIGQRVRDKMQAFMQVDTFDTAHDAPESFESKVRAADCVTLHVPLNDETRGLFNTERLAWLPDGALLVNTARGAVVDESALFAELSSGRLRAAIDVFWEEPYRGNLTELPADRFIRTPHIASTCQEFIQGTATDFLNFLHKISGHKDV